MQQKNKLCHKKARKVHSFVEISDSISSGATGNDLVRT